VKKLMVVFAGLVLAGSGVFTMSASAEKVESDIGTLYVNDADAEGYTILADGAGDSNPNPDPLDGYLGVGDDNSIQCGDEGDGYTYTEVTDPETGETTIVKERKNDGCNPSA